MELQVGVKALLRNKEGKYLLVRRSPEKYPEAANRWGIVGGRINPGATLMENLKREIKEETKLELKKEPRLVAAQDILRIAGRHIVNYQPLKRLACSNAMHQLPLCHVVYSFAKHLVHVHLSKFILWLKPQAFFRHTCKADFRGRDRRQPGTGRRSHGILVGNSGRNEESGPPGYIRQRAHRQKRDSLRP